MRVEFLHMIDAWHRPSVTVKFTKEIMVLSADQSFGSCMWLLFTNPIKDSALQCIIAI